MSNSRVLNWSKRTFAAFCVLLVVFGITVQLTHTHLSKEISHADCSLCITAHATPVAAGSPNVPVAATFLSVVETPAVLERPTLTLGFAQFTRPPPVVSFSA